MLVLIFDYHNSIENKRTDLNRSTGWSICIKMRFSCEFDKSRRTRKFKQLKGIINLSNLVINLHFIKLVWSSVHAFWGSLFVERASDTGEHYLLNCE